MENNGLRKEIKLPGMIAMAAGNVYGGRSADKRPDPDILYRTPDL